MAHYVVDLWDKELLYKILPIYIYKEEKSLNYNIQNTWNQV